MIENEWQEITKKNQAKLQQSHFQVAKVNHHGENLKRS